MLVCSSNWGVSNNQQLPEKGPEFLSEEWLDLFKHTLDEAERLGLQVGVNFCASGWTMGGPWITPEMNGRWFVQSETKLTGPMEFRGELPLPNPRNGYKPPHFLNVGLQMQWPLEKMDYRDNAIVAFRSKDKSTFDANRLSMLDVKSNRKDGDAFMTPDMVMRPTLQPIPGYNSDQPIDIDSVVNVSTCLLPDGTFRWDVPPGEWTLVRTGHVATGAPLMCILPEMTEGALGVDWLNAASVDTMFKYMGDILIRTAGKKHVGKTLTFFHTDSFEDGYPNWTDDLLDKFETYRGYDPVPYLPVLSGYIVGSAEISDRFLHDYRKTVADLFADGSLKRLADRSARHGMFYQGETAGPSWSGTVCIDALKNLGRTDRPMGEFWSNHTFISEGAQNYVCKQTASAAHIYGKRIANAEAFTNTNHWTESPEFLKPIADRAFCEGINKITFHTITLQRLQDGKPGYEYGAGTHFNPNVTWWNLGAQEWVSYLSRCSELLQGGMFVADVLYYNGDGAPNLVPAKHVDSSLGAGFDYDVCNEEVLLTRVDSKNGFIVLPDGMRYRVLVLPDCEFMPLEVIEKIKSLVLAGATVIGPKPKRDAGLKDYPYCDQKIKEIAEEVWGPVDGNIVSEHRYGKGKIVWGKPVRSVLAEMNVSPDVTIQNRAHLSSCFIDFIHRTYPDMELYFLANRKDERAQADISFRVSEGTPELWDPVTGEKRVLPEYSRQDGRYIIPLTFNPYDSYFIVFNKRKKSQENILTPSKNFSDTVGLMTLSDVTWTLTFDKEWLYPQDNITGGGHVLKLDSLYDLSQHASHAIRHYSGTIQYETNFVFNGNPDSYEQIGIDLGDVSVLAKVTLNGVCVGTTWRAPFILNVSDVIKRGENHIVIEVANLWQNRLVGDEFLPKAQQKTFTNMKVYRKDSPLQPSGLMGPVSLVEITYAK